MNRIIGNTLTILVASLALTACGGLDETPTDETPPNENGTAGGEDNTFDHENLGFDPFDLIDKLTKEGPPRFTSRVHGCVKVRVATLGNVLVSLGVDINEATLLSAGQLYTSGFNALGGPNYGARIRENLNITTSGASREFDIFAAAAPTIITAVPGLARCQVGGVGAQLFDPVTNACRADGVTCLIGAPATAAHLDFCNIAVNGATDIDTGKRIAVAAILAAAYTCE